MAFRYEITARRPFGRYTLVKLQTVDTSTSKIVEKTSSLSVGATLLDELGTRYVIESMSDGWFVLRGRYRPAGDCLCEDVVLE